jgi:hypothetical protein
MTRFTSILALFLAYGLATIASAAIIVENGPATSLSYRIGGSNSQAEAVGWFQFLSNYTDITALIGSVDGNTRSVNAYLEYNTIGNVIATATVNVGSFASSADFTPVTIFSGLSLGFGVYRLTLYNTDTSGSTNVRWSVGASTTNTVNGVFVNSQFSNAPDTNISAPYLSNFTDSPEPLGFTVSSSPVPEPGTLTLVGMGALGMAFSAIRRRRGN